MKIQDLRKLLASSLDLEQFQVEGILERLTPVILADSLLGDEEAGAGPRWCVGGANQAAVAANYSIVHLQNPAASGILAEVHLISGSLSGTQDVLIGWSETQVANAGYNTVQNRYQGTVAAPATATCRVTREEQAATGIAAAEMIHQHLTLANTRLVFEPLGMILRPGTGVRVVSGAVNLALRGYFVWKEVPEK